MKKQESLRARASRSTPTSATEGDVEVGRWVIDVSGWWVMAVPKWIVEVGGLVGGWSWFGLVGCS